MMIDAHVHLWRLCRGDYGWLTPDQGVLHRDYEAPDLEVLLHDHGLRGAVLVQAAPTEAETRFLLDIAVVTPAVLGVVGWADLLAPDAADSVARLSSDPHLKALRPMLQDLADDDFILSPAVQPALAAMAQEGLVYEALVRPRHLGRLMRLREQHPDLPIVIDHAAKPDIASGAWQPWAGDLRRLAADGATVCKLSGLVTEAGAGWDVERLRPYAEAVLEAFGPERVIWGGDWPVVLTACGYDRWLQAARTLTAGLNPQAAAAVFGGTARRVYGLGVPEEAGD